MKRSRTLNRLRERMLTRPIEDEEHAYYTTIADQVTKRRAALELSQRELAVLCGTTQSAIARLERGGRPPRIDTLLGVANALDCELLIQLRPRTRARNQR